MNEALKKASFLLVTDKFTFYFLLFTFYNTFVT